MKAWQHLRTILHHKKMVREGCFRVGLYRQGIMHDWSKYTPVEFLVGAKYYQGDKSPNNIERQEKGYSGAYEGRPYGGDAYAAKIRGGNVY